MQARASVVQQPLPRKLVFGNWLVRDLRGKGYKLTGLADGLAHDGWHWKRLAAFAIAVNGNQWNGPLFVGH